MKDSASETQKSIIAVTFGEELGNQQRPTLERIDMKLGHFNKQKNKWKIKCVICEWNLLFWTLDLAYFGEKRDLNFNYLAGPMKKMAIPQHGPENKFQLWTQNIKMAGGVGWLGMIGMTKGDWDN